ncbi:MAG: hybrid sensor histidine kinase/response regulator transcription factor, partial [Paludibacter sp.]|nr:hybrid sensor histidine kinase/response regulator transcription factor [Paludibacter sp.]
MFGSSRGVVKFDPDKLNDASLGGHIFLQDIKVSGRSIREISNFELKSPLNNQESIKLKYFQNTLELELLPLGVNSAEYKFSWKMKGLDKDWNALSNHKLITYTNLPSGSYDLQIRMYDNSLSTIIDERVIHIRIIPPFWQAWWFRLFLFVAAMAIVYFSLKYYANKLKQEHNEDKIRFFATTAHEIRTSLTLISAPIEELSNEKQLSAKGSYFLNLAKEQTGRMLFVATQLLDFQKVDIGKGQVFLVMVDVVKLVQRRISMFEATASKMGLTLEFKSNQTSYLTAVDELKIEKVIDNLISNAIKYSHQNGKIEIRLTADDENWIVEVKDFGLGISENAQKKLFKEFYRGDNVINSKIVGSGIGLLLVKNYVSMHEGEVVLKSKENEGTEFRITIPYRKVDETVDELERPLQQAQPIHQSFVDVELAESTTTVSVSEKKLHLLVVEDNSDLREFLKNSFDELYKVSTANDGKQAWEIIQKKVPDLIVSDIMMPNMNGFDLCKLIKSTFETSHIPVILLTSLDERSKQLEGLGLGADDYITKPFDVSILKQRIISIIKNRDIVRDKVLKLFNQTDQEVPILSNEQNDQFVKKALKVVRENIANSEFGKDEFASAMNASPSLLYKKIKALTGQSPIDFIKKIRLDHSLELLQSRKYSITEVSEQCGFSSVGYFSTVFKKHFDKTPSEIIS